MGKLTLNGQTPEQLCIPKWRALVSYVFQSRVAHKGTPSELWFTVQQFKAQRGRPRGDLPALIHDLGLEQEVLNQPWTQLSVREWGGCAGLGCLVVCLSSRPSSACPAACYSVPA